MDTTIRKQPPSSSFRRRENLWGYLCISPWIIGMLAFIILPMVASFGMSFFDISFNPDQVASTSLTKTSLAQLRAEGLPARYVERLTGLQGQKYASKEEFLKAVVTDAGVPAYQLTADSWEKLQPMLPDDVVTRVQPLHNREFPNEEAFMAAVQEQLGAQTAAQYRMNLLVYTDTRFSQLIWKHAKKSYWKGGEYWRRLFNDPEVLPAIGKTFQIMLLIVPGMLVLALLLAILLHSPYLKAASVFRAIFYMPAVMPIVAVTMIWAGLFDQDIGWVNLFLEQWFSVKALGREGINWLTNPNLIYYILTLIGIWGLGPTMLILLAGLQNIPTELYEAAYVDGAGWWRRLVHVTLPMLTPSIFYCLVIALIGMMQYFMAPFVLNGDATGAPNGKTLFIMIYFIRNLRYGYYAYSAVLAWVILFFSLLITLVLFGTKKYWVFYVGEK